VKEGASTFPARRNAVKAGTLTYNNVSTARMKYLILLSLFCVSIIPSVVPAQEIPDSSWYLTAMEWPVLEVASAKKPVVIAVIDDGFDLDHPDLKPFWWRSGREIPGNSIDDDGNGYRDDHLGWDVADSDPDVSFPQGREPFFYHGTFVTGVITSLLQRSYGPRAPQLFKILPVKALSDGASQTYLREGYAGISYAVDRKVDLIVCAWSGGVLSEEEERLLRRATELGIPLLASAGNTYDQRIQPPAVHPNVVAVSAVDHQLHKLPVANYGMPVDLSGPGQGVFGAKVGGGQQRGDGTSAAVAVVAAATALLRLEDPARPASDLIRILKNTASPINRSNQRFTGKLGAGFPNVSRALQWIRSPDRCCQPHQPGLSEGTLSPETMPANTRQHSWTIAPEGAYEGIHVQWSIPRGTDRESIRIHDARGQMVHQSDFRQDHQLVFVPGEKAVVTYERTRGRTVSPFHLDYWVETIDSSTLYCEETRFWETPEGQFTDGSGDQPYANNCDCRWQITVPENKRIEIWFEEFSTQAQRDYLYLFDGTSSIPARAIAKFSGPGLPPRIRSRTNQVLVWFVTDGSGADVGWTLRYRVVGRD